MVEYLPGSPKFEARTRLREQLLANDCALLIQVVDRWIADAIKGDNRAREQLLDRLEGKVEQSISATVTSRYVIEEIGIPYVDAPHRVVTVGSDNTHYVALCAGETDALDGGIGDGRERESDDRPTDPDSGIVAATEGAPSRFPLPAS